MVQERARVHRFKDHIKTVAKVETAGGVGKRGALVVPCCCLVTILSFIDNINLFNTNDLLENSDSENRVQTIVHACR